MDFNVTILGSNSAIPAHGRNQTSQFITLGKTHLLVDCGEGTQIQLRKFKLRFSRIEYIFISHLHGDHYYGLIGLISSFHLHKRTKLLTIFGPNGLDEIITTQLKHSNTRLNYPIRFEATNPDSQVCILEENTYRVSTFPMKHRIPCTGFLIEEKIQYRNLIKEKLAEEKLPVPAIISLREGKDYQDKNTGRIFRVSDYTYPPRKARSYAYCSDTAFDTDLVPIIKGASLLYHEATFGSDETERAKETFHSTAAQAGEIAAKAEVEMLLLGHYSTRYIDLTGLLVEAKQQFSNSHLSEEGVTYTLE